MLGEIELNLMLIFIIIANVVYNEISLDIKWEMLMTKFI
jgi:hypothetical protein